MLFGKKIIVGVSGSIAAYKSAYLIRSLIKLGAEVKVIMTPSSMDFISPLTLATLSKNPVILEFIKNKEGEWENHVELGLWADLFIIAPCSANTLSKLVSGNCDNILLATYLSSRCPVWIAPAMDLDMFAHFSTQENLKLLSEKGINVIEPTDGELASGLEGKGRMEEPETIAELIDEYFQPSSKLKNKTVLVTGGPTYEPIDPVRFIGNHSSGKTGVLLADALADRGANVILVTGPTHEKVKDHRIKVVPVTTAIQMKAAVELVWEKCDIGIFSAAVADYRPIAPAGEKIKKKDNELTLQLTKNPDILAWAGENKKTLQFLAGFALETTNEMAHATEKFNRKNLDLLVLNSLKDEGAGFGKTTNKVTILKKNNKFITFELKNKSAVVNDILDEIESEIS
jgi:phosphopantothenoylcysteine decarboxylase/phosphopantothenate--cysteine ligase